MADRHQFENTAYKLADVESHLIDAAEAAEEAQDNADFIAVQKRNLIIALAMAVVGTILMIVFPLKGLLAMCPEFLLVYGLFSMYTAYGGIHFAKNSIFAQEYSAQTVTKLNSARNQLTAELVEMQMDDSSLPQECWWNAGTDIGKIWSFHSDVPEGYDLMLVNELSIQERDCGFYLEDFTKTPVLWTADKVNERIHEKGMIILYENPDYAVDRIPQYISFRLYNVKIEAAKPSSDLWNCSFLSEAEVYLAVAADGTTEEAYIAAPVYLPPETNMTLMADNKEHPTCGFLEAYVGKDGLSSEDTKIPLHFMEVVQFLFSPKTREALKLKDRDILAPKPENLSKEFWTYLIAKDHMRSNLPDNTTGIRKEPNQMQDSAHEG